MPTGTGVNGLVKNATNFLSQVPGGEKLVLQAVKDMLDELGDLRRQNDRLRKQNATLQERLERTSRPRRSTAK